MKNSNQLKELVDTVRHITYATVNEDGSPHNSPMFFIPSEKLDKLYLGTHPDSLHAKNMVRTGQAFGVIFDQIYNPDVGLYFKLEDCHAVNPSELDEALGAHNAARARLNKSPLEKSYYEAPDPQRMYVCNIIETSTNDVVRGKDGHITQDTRTLINPYSFTT